MKKLETNTTLPVIKFNFEDLKTWAEDTAKKYNGLVVREEDVKDIKKDMAELNKRKSELNSAKKSIVEQVSTPIKQFESQIKEVVSIIETARDGLDVQVKKFVEQQREQKRHEVQFMIESLSDDHGVLGLKIPIQDNWLTKTKTKKSITAEIESFILTHIKQENEKVALEQAKKDRAMSIERHCSTMAEKYSVALDPSSFLRLNDLQIPLEEAFTQVETAFQTSAARMGIKQEPEPQIETPIQNTTQPYVQSSSRRPVCPAPGNPPRRQAQQVELISPASKIATIEITYPVSKERELENLLNSLSEKGLEVSLINVSPARDAAA